MPMISVSALWGLYSAAFHLLAALICICPFFAGYDAMSESRESQRPSPRRSKLDFPGGSGGHAEASAGGARDHHPSAIQASTAVASRSVCQAPPAMPAAERRPGPKARQVVRDGRAAGPPEA